MPADRFQKSVKQVKVTLRKGPLFHKEKKSYQSQAAPPSKMVVTNTATGQPELWDIKPWSVKQVKDLIPDNRYWGPKWYPADPPQRIEVNHTPEEREALLWKCYEESDHLREQAKLLRAEHAHKRHLEVEAEQAYLDKVVARYPGYHPTLPTPSKLFNRVLSEESAAHIAKMVQIEPEWMKDHMHLLPDETVRDRIAITYKKYEWALRLLPILEETDRILNQLYRLILDDPSMFHQEKDSQDVVHQIQRYRTFYKSFFMATLYGEVSNKELWEIERDADTILSSMYCVGS
ncbi:hypothetical protein WOLCODRAFT_147237 [Wolfiporia cocos MD-104 SS10]|uniref:Uncharacterized protein n=1 Tax=Wolfiporia cocos (strain MD-104) TaxID=742152 RepID=A0A2H3JB12_WOLCO|nr:hypothetical protein WOLCODRAFT_147237 [Wolfiporia cocos MD-104 SS10]